MSDLNYNHINYYEFSRTNPEGFLVLEEFHNKVDRPSRGLFLALRILACSTLVGTAIPSLMGFKGNLGEIIGGVVGFAGGAIGGAIGFVEMNKAYTKSKAECDAQHEIEWRISRGEITYYSDAMAEYRRTKFKLQLKALLGRADNREMRHEA